MPTPPIRMEDICPRCGGCMSIDHSVVGTTVSCEKGSAARTTSPKVMDFA